MLGTVERFIGFSERCLRDEGKRGTPGARRVDAYQWAQLSGLTATRSRVTINRNFREGDDNSWPILGERANNAVVLIDGMPNRDEVNGGPAGQFDQDSILEFQVLTSGYKAEFGHGSGGIVNVLTKSGTNDWHGTASLFIAITFWTLPTCRSPTFLFFSAGTPVQPSRPACQSRVFFFGAAERISRKPSDEFSVSA